MKNIKLYGNEATVQNILRHYYPAYEKSTQLEEHVRNAAFKLMNCRTDEFGGHKFVCPDCGEEKIVYNPCHHRSCPACSSIAKEEWLNKQIARLPNCGYYHVIFTVPQELNLYFQLNRSAFIDKLFESMKESILGMTSNEEFLGAEPGIQAVLHTWGSALPQHPHLHVLVTDGGLDKNGQWISSKKSKKNKKGFLVPVVGEKGLMGVFKSKLIYKLKGLLYKNKLVLIGEKNKLESERELNALLSKSWNVYIEEKAKESQKVLKYLSAYVKGGAISNRRIKKVVDGKVYFEFKNSRKGRKKEICKLEVFEFIRRLFLHIPEKGKKVVRNYGLFANSKKKELNIVRLHFGQLPLDEVKVKEVKREVKCKACNGIMINYCEIESKKQRVAREFEMKLRTIKRIS